MMKSDSKNEVVMDRVIKYNQEAKNIVHSGKLVVLGAAN